MMKRTSSLKRTGFKRKTPTKTLTARKRLVTKPSKRKKATPEAKLKKKLWELCKQIIRKKYGNTCYTCGAMGLAGSNWHTGHFIPSSVCGLYLRYDLRNLRPQCYRCNISLSGNGSIYYRRLVNDMGQAYVDQLFQDRNKITKGSKTFIEGLIHSYTAILMELTTG